MCIIARRYGAIVFFENLFRGMNFNWNSIHVLIIEMDWNDCERERFSLNLLAVSSDMQIPPSEERRVRSGAGVKGVWRAYSPNGSIT